MVTDANDIAELRGDLTIAVTSQDTPVQTNDGYTVHYRGNRDSELTLMLYDSSDAQAMFDLLADADKSLIVGAEWGGGNTGTMPAQRWFAGEYQVFDHQYQLPVGANVVNQYTLRQVGKFKRGRTA